MNKSGSLRLDSVLSVGALLWDTLPFVVRMNQRAVDCAIVASVCSIYTDRLPFLRAFLYVHERNVLAVEPGMPVKAPAVPPRAAGWTMTCRRTKGCYIPNYPFCGVPGRSAGCWAGAGSTA